MSFAILQCPFPSFKYTTSKTPKGVFLYFLEFLETCTIGWVSFCEGGVGLFYFFGGDGTDRAGLGGGCMPRRWLPTPSSAPGQTATHRRHQGRPCQMQAQTMQGKAHTPGRWTRCTGLHPPGAAAFRGSSLSCSLILQKESSYKAPFYYHIRVLGWYCILETL